MALGTRMVAGQRPQLQRSAVGNYAGGPSSALLRCKVESPPVSGFWSLSGRLGGTSRHPNFPDCCQSPASFFFVALHCTPIRPISGAPAPLSHNAMDARHAITRLTGRSPAGRSLAGQVSVARRRPRELRAWGRSDWLLPSFARSLTQTRWSCSGRPIWTGARSAKCPGGAAASGSQGDTSASEVGMPSSPESPVLVLHR
jgi:hypothetical protein